MTSTGSDLDHVLVIDREAWAEGPPHALFSRLRNECPVHWSNEIPEFPEESGYWSVTRPEDIHAVSRDWQTYSSERRGITAASAAFPLELIQAMFIGMDPPRHDRLKALFQAGFTPKRIAQHEDEIRAIVIRVLDRLDGRATCDLVTDVAQPAVSRVIHSFMGVPESDDAMWADLMNATLGAGDPDLNPEGLDAVVEKLVPRIFDRVRALIAERRERPTDDLTSVLVHAEVDGHKLEEHEIVMGFFLLVAAGNDSTKATYCSGMRALMEHPDQRKLLFDDPSLIPGAVEEALRMYPAFAHFARTATADVGRVAVHQPAQDAARAAAPAGLTPETYLLHHEPVTDRVLGDHVRLDEVQDVCGAAGLGAGARQAVAAEGLAGDHGAGDGAV